MRALAAATLAAAALAAGACSSGGAPALDPGSPASPPAHEDCPAVQQGSGNAAVDYVDFIQAFGQQYVAGLARRPITARQRDLGRIVLRSSCSLSALNDRTHKDPGPARDGDTGFLKPGTPIYAVDGWPTQCRLAARWGGRLRVYLAYLPNAAHATPRPCALR